MSDLPAPLTPPDCDLRGYDFMPLFGQKLFASRLYTKSLRQPRAGMAALKLWWCAWQQCPAGSLPDDDDDLAILADFGTDMKAWKAAREIALHGFVKCSDGRLYHPMLCDEAKDAYERRVRERERKAEMRAKKKGRPKSQDTENGGTGNGSPKDVPRDNQRTVEGQTAPVRVDSDRDRDSDNNIPPNDPPAGDQTDDAQTDLEAAIAAQKPTIPGWVPVAEWNAFIEMRRKRKKPPTDHAVKLLIGALTKFRDQGHEPAAVLNRSTVNGWLDLFPLKPEHQSRQSRHAESMAGFAHIPDIEGI